MKWMKYLIVGVVMMQFVHASAQSQNIPEYRFEQLEPLLHQNNDTTYVVNFWATWCKPCVDELPVFIKLSREMASEPVKFLFVSLDFPTQKESRLIPFAEKNGMLGQVLLLNDPQSNRWIDKVDTQWSGAIPATLIYKGNQRLFNEGQLSEDKLKENINRLK